MLAGFVDGRGRKYDLNFRTLRTRLVDEAGEIVLADGESATARVACEAEASVRFESKSLPFLLRAPGQLTATSRRFVFVVGPGARRPTGQVSLLNVKLPLHPEAISAFFLEQDGREYLEFSPAEVMAARDGRAGVEVEFHGPSPGRPEERATFIAVFSPGAAVRGALEGLL